MKVVRLFEKGDHDGAIAALNAHFAVYDTSPPSPKAPIRSNMMAATLAFWLAKPSLVRESILTVVQQIRAGGRPYKQETRKYIINYCEYIDRISTSHYEDAYEPVGDVLNVATPDNGLSPRSEIQRIFPIG